MKKKQNSEVTDAVKKLRQALGETQETFAKRLGTATSSLVRYESSRQPRGEVLAKLLGIAGKHDQPQFVEVFLKALAKETGEAVAPKIDFRDDEERDYTLALLAAFRNTQYEAILEKVKGLLKEPLVECGRRLREFQAAKGVERAAAKLLEEGRSPESVADVLGIALEAVTKIDTWQRFLSMAKRSGLTKK